MCVIMLQVLYDIEYAKVDPDLPDYEIRKLQQDYLNYFFVGANVSALLVGFVLVDIHCTYMGFQLILYFIFQIVHNYFKYNPIFSDNLFLVMMLQFFVYITEYK
jgi:hypothetical protein